MTEWHSGKPPAPGWYFSARRKHRESVMMESQKWRWWSGEWWSIACRPGASANEVLESASTLRKEKNRLSYSFRWPDGDHPNAPQRRPNPATWPDGTPRSINNAFTRS